MKIYGYAVDLGSIVFCVDRLVLGFLKSANHTFD